MTRNSARNLALVIAELAEESRSRIEFRLASLACLQRAIGFELGLLQSTVSNTANGIDFPYDNERVTNDFARAVDEFRTDEIRRMLGSPPLDSDELFSSARKDELFVFHGVLRPLGMHCELEATWCGRTSVLSCILARERAAMPFRASERQLLESVRPLLSTAEVLLARARSENSRDWLSAYGLTAQQQRVADLVMRGLTNREVAQVLGCAELTVRNHLAAIFRKVGGRLCS